MILYLRKIWTRTLGFNSSQWEEIKGRSLSYLISSREVIFLFDANKRFASLMSCPPIKSLAVAKVSFMITATRGGRDELIFPESLTDKTHSVDEETGSHVIVERRSSLLVVQKMNLWQGSDRLVCSPASRRCPRVLFPYLHLHTELLLLIVITVS